MPRVIVTTDDGREVWALDDVASTHVSTLQCAMNATGRILASGIRRAVADAEAIQEGRDPERPSERAMRRAAPEFDPRVDYPERFKEGPI